jgi:hypothetical protein
VHNHQVAPSFKIWAKIAKTWRKMVKVVNFYPLVSSFWEICKVKKGPTKWEFMIFGSKLKDLQFDVNRWKWNYEIDKL